MPVGEMERELKASGMTIRRDRTALDATGQARRTRGGMVAINHQEALPFR